MQLLTKEKRGGEEKEAAEKRYYKAIAKNPKAALIKCIDGVNNVSCMIGGFSGKKMADCHMTRRDLKYRVLKPILDEVSDMGISFLRAMAGVEKGSLMPDIAERLGKTASCVSTFRRRLTVQGVIESRCRNQVVYALPSLRKFLSEYDR